MSKINSQILIAVFSIIPAYLITFFANKITLVQIDHRLSTNFTAGQIAVILYAVYLIAVSIYLFSQVTKLWQKKAPWVAALIKSYLLLLLFVIFVSILIVVSLDSQRRGFLDSFGSLGFTLWYMPMSLLMTFPVALYLIYSGIRSLMTAKSQNLSRSYGITLLLINLLPLLFFGLLLFIIPRLHWGFV